MSYYDDDFYHEPNEYDMLVNDFRESLMKSVKEGYIQEMEKLKKENVELQVVKKDFDKIKNSYDQKQRDLKYEYEELKRRVRRERLNELMKELDVEMYSVASRGKEKPKCDQCDDSRQIRYKNPLGYDRSDTCDCASKEQVYEPIPIILSTFSIRNGEGFSWYKIVDRDNRDEYLSYYDDSISGKELITDESQFKDIGYSYKTLFKTKEIAQKFCDYKNNKSD